MPLAPLLASITALLGATPLDVAVAESGVSRAALLTGVADHIAQRRCWPDASSCELAYDLASVTKPITALAVLSLDVGLDDLVRTHLPELARREPITVRQLLEHTSRLRPVVKVADLPAGSPDRVLDRIVKSRLWPGPVYSDLNFVVAGRLVEKVTGRALGDVLRLRFFAPLGMSATGFRPEAYAPNGAPPRLPHDPIAQVCLTATSAPGHAGLFSTVDDLGLLLRALTGTAAQLEALRAEHAAGHPAGWTDWGAGSWGKVGWTGTFIWYDPPTKRWAVFLTNRTDGDHGFIDFELVVAEARR